MKFRYGDIYYFFLGGDKKDKVVGGKRPCLVVQNNKVNYFSETVLIAPISSSARETHSRKSISCGKVEGLVCFDKIRVVEHKQCNSVLIGTVDMEQFSDIIKYTLGVE